jgi:hypothetical protein
VRIVGVNSHTTAVACATDLQVLVRATSSVPSKNARLVITYVPGDYHFLVDSLTPTPKVAAFSVATGRLWWS